MYWIISSKLPVEQVITSCGLPVDTVMIFACIKDPGSKLSAGLSNSRLYNYSLVVNYTRVFSSLSWGVHWYCVTMSPSAGV